MKLYWYSIGIAVIGVVLVYLRNFLVLKDFESKEGTYLPEESSVQLTCSYFKYRNFEPVYLAAFIIALALLVYDFLIWIFP